MWSDESDTDLDLVGWLDELHGRVQKPTYPHALAPEVQAVLDASPLPEDSLDDDLIQRGGGE
jgi:hypothetical protein